MKPDDGSTAPPRLGDVQRVEIIALICRQLLDATPRRILRPSAYGLHPAHVQSLWIIAANARLRSARNA